MSELRIIRRSQIDGDFEGFDDEVLFCLTDGTYWVQDEYKYWYYYAYCPIVFILQEGSRLFLQVDGQSEIVPVREVHDVIRSRVNGEFTGWEGETAYELVNGQVWRQSQYKYQYKYAYMPDLVIFNTGGGYKMVVAGTSARVQRVT